MKIKIKKLSPAATIPSYSKDGDACFDLTATSKNDCGSYIEFGTGLAIEIPKGFFGFVRPRSSVSKTQYTYNTSGIIDSGYRGELTVRFKRMHFYGASDELKVGDRIAQLMILPYPAVEFEEVTELSETERGTGGYGSTGK